MTMKCLTMLALVGAIFWTTAAQGAVPCGLREEMLAELEKRYGETPVAIAVTDTGAAVEVVSSDSGGTWSILVTVAGQPTCLVAAGTDWMPVTKGKGA